METRRKLLYPSLVIAAISVTVFSLLGIATLTGAMPRAWSDGRDAVVDESAQPAVARAAPAKVAARSGNLRLAGNERSAASSQVPCVNCGTVESVRLVERKGEGTGLGAVTGGVAGALLGNQMGRGNGRTAMTVVGAAGGAYAGHEIEKNVRKSSSYQVRVRMEDGSIRTLYQNEAPRVAAGDPVKISDGQILPRG